MTLNDIPEQYPVGTQFTPLGRKRPRLETVVDIHTTTNMAGGVVRVRYLAEHSFLGHAVRTEFTKTTISRALYT